MRPRRRAMRPVAVEPDPAPTRRYSNESFSDVDGVLRHGSGVDIRECRAALQQPREPRAGKQHDHHPGDAGRSWPVHSAGRLGRGSFRPSAACPASRGPRLTRRSSSRSGYPMPGTAGSTRAATGDMGAASTFPAGFMIGALNRGYAVAGTDMGHPRTFGTTRPGPSDIRRS